MFHLHDPNGWVATGAVCPQIHKVHSGTGKVKYSLALLEKLFRTNGLQMFWV